MFSFSKVWKAISFTWTHIMNTTFKSFQLVLKTDVDQKNFRLKNENLLVPYK